MQNVQQFIECIAEEQVADTWGVVLMDQEVATAIVPRGSDVAAQVIAKALTFVPRWTTTRCAVVAEGLTGVPMVSESAGE